MFGMKCHNFLSFACLLHISICVLLSVLLLAVRPSTAQQQLQLNQREGFFNKTSYVRLFSALSLKQHIGLSFKTCVGGQLFSQRTADQAITLEVLPEGLVFSVTLYSPTTKHFESRISANFLNNVWHTVNILNRLGNLTITAAGHQQVVSNSTYNPEILMSPDVPQIAELNVGHGFVGCILEGPSLIFNSTRVQHVDVVWGPCPLTPSSCTQDYCKNEPCMMHGTCYSKPDKYQCHCAARYSGNNCEIDNGSPCKTHPCLNSGLCKETSIGDYFCQCATGFTGQHCETEVSSRLCENNPCLNGGTCTEKTGGNQYECICIPGFSGKDCETNINDCLSSPCQNSGICIDGINNYTCSCNHTGYEGPNCEININECERTPCINGKCFDNYGGYTCQCLPGFGGQNCEMNLNECSSAPCRNEGTCMDIVGSYKCVCNNFFTGPNCEISLKDCKTIPCPPNSACINTNGTFQCICKPGYVNVNYGNNHHVCIESGDICSATACRNGGKCVPHPVDGFNCTCLPGFTGLYCESHIGMMTPDWCSAAPCYNGGTCTNELATYICHCPPPFTGGRCESIIKCSSKPCKHATSCDDFLGSTGYYCTCERGWTGQNCDVEINECLTNPCQFGGTCTDQLGGFYCTCPLGFTGDLCETNINECSSTPCLNGGVCIDGINGYTCNCTEEFTGNICETIYDSCNFSPCQNNGTCLHDPKQRSRREYFCQCITGFQGKNCEENIDDCLGIECPIYKICRDGINKYECVCPEGFTGDNCTVKLQNDFCKTYPCKNNGTCVDGMGNYTCICPKGWTGTNCEQDVNECESKPCQHGICQNKEGGYQCFCQPGYTGDHCDLDFDECLSQPCANHSVCRNMVNNFFCECAQGYTGRVCEINIDECLSNPCQNGATCIDGIASFTCNCPPGLTGQLCETNIDDCESSPCQHNGLCEDGINSYACNCSDTGYEGMHCEVNIDDCKSSPCENGAECRDQVKDYYCECFKGYKGKNCEIDINECDINPCQHGGTCLELSNATLYKAYKEDQSYLPSVFNQDFNYTTASGYACICVPGVRGENCNENINECESNPCYHGKCHDQINGYSCECEEGYEGVHCNIDINECERYTPCVHGECYDQKAGYLCDCEVGYGGKNCSVELTGCKSNECQNGGTCKPYLEAETRHLFNCTCPNGYHGKVCEKLTTMSLDGSSYVMVNTTREEGYEIHFRFKTTLPNGLLALGKGSTYYILELVQGKLNLHSSLLNKWEGVSIGSKLNDSNWQKVFVAINTSHLVLAANEEQTIYPINQNEGANASHTSFPITYVGGTIPPLRRFPNGNQPYFVGCTQDIFINGLYVLPQESENLPIDLVQVDVGCVRKPQCDPNPCHSGGHCTDLWRKFSCTCKRPYLGHTCQYNLTAATFGYENINTSLVTVTVSPHVRQVVQSIVDISMFIRTRQSVGGIFYLGSKPGSVAYPNETLMTAQLSNGELQVLIHFNGNSESYIVGGERLDDGNNHLIQVIRNVTLVQVKINSTEYFRKTISATGKLDLQVLYLGKIPPFNSSLNSRVRRQLSNDVASSIGFKGVIQDVQISNGSQTMVVEFFPLKKNDDDDLDLPPSVGEVVFDPNSVLEGIRTDNTCANNPCLQGGKCVVTWNDYICHCTRGYKGKRCEEMEFCQLKNCPAGSVCRNVNRGYECVANITLAGDGTKLSYSLEQGTEKHIVPQDIEISYRSRTGGTLLYIGPDPATGQLYFQISVHKDQVTVAWRLNSGSNGEVYRMSKGQSDGEWTTIVLKMVNDTLNGRLLNTPEDATHAQINNNNFPSADWYDLILNSPITVGGTASSLTMGDKNSYVSDTANTNEVNNIAMLEQKQLAGAAYKGCIGEVRIGDLLLPYFTPAQLNVTNASRDHFVLNNESNFTLNCLLCFQSECYNGGTCANETESYLCACPPGFTGHDCKEDIDECIGNQCQNDAVCVDGLANYTCNCALGWEGWLCDKEINECASNPCKNNGTCHDRLGSFECVCLEEYVGAQCEQLRQVTCENKPCRNGASCSDFKNPKTNDNFTCSCLEGFVGTYCETAYCITTPCLNNGLCDNTTLSPRCICEPGFQGRLCEEDIDDCKAMPCLHKGMCIDGVAAYKCNCTGTGYKGKNCEKDIDECLEDVPCNFGGRCENTPGGFRCRCDDGFCGRSCDQSDPCAELPCKNGGTCIPDCVNAPDYQCMCTVGLAGKNCTESNLLAQSNVYDIALIVGPVIAILLIAGGTSLTVFLMMARKKRATRGTYSPSSQEYCNPRVELDNVMKPPPEERLI